MNINLGFRFCGAIKKPLSLAVIAAFVPVASVAADQALGEVTVTATREGQLKSETPATVDLIKGETLREVRPTHPSEIMGLVPGVWVNVTGGEGHQTAIRQPLTTNPVYLYLEDGVPTRSTGFFNHNALYEVNLPMAGGIEVSKGPGSALYGSDAIGGVVNVLTRKPPVGAEIEGSLEAGSYGWARALITGGGAFGNHAYRGVLNLTRTDGWREATGYERQSATLRWDNAVGGDGVLKTVATFSNIDQQTAGSSTLSLNDYQNNPRDNYTPISLRRVQAARLSSAYEMQSGDSLFSITPYYRYDNMDLLPNWTLSFDPTRYTTQNQSVGVLLKYRQDFEPLRARLITGVDLDYSPGSRVENAIFTTKAGSGISTTYTNYSLGPLAYDYDVSYMGIAPYVHAEITPLPGFRLTAGLRYDNITYAFDNHFSTTQVVGSRYYGQVNDTDIKFRHLSPKIGATYAFSDSLSGFAAYNNAFRAPSEGQLFRPAVASNALAARAAAYYSSQLKPIIANSYEIGLRGTAGSAVNFEVSLYDMTKKDDILNFQDPVTNVTTPTNAGETLHRGIEIGIGAQLAALWRIDVAYSYAKHTYESWKVGRNDYSGNEMEFAPRNIANTGLSFGNVLTGLARLEWVHLSSWWSNQANTLKYSGYDLVNLRGQYPVARDVNLFANIHNLADTRYAETTGTQTSGNVTYQMYAPGLPRTLIVGVQAKW